MLYFRLSKTLHGYLRSAIIFFKHLLADMEKVGFTINPYDHCVVNKTVNRQALTIVWYVGDLKISHMDPK